MINFIIKQVSPVRPDPLNSDRRGALLIYDFCKSKKWGDSDDWLTNKRNNGWSHKEKWGYYTKFKLELIK